MDVKKLIKKTLNSTCIFFTIITALYMLIMLIINVSDGSAQIEAERVLLFFVFSLLLSIANALVKAKAIHIALRYLIHYLICAIGFWLCFCLPNKMDASKTLVGIVLFSILYAIIMTLRGIFSRRFKKIKQKESNEKYEKQFSGKK
ncbi:MAG: DUF3021 family protein [Clostridia bacterium]|nr:DUF3021 family protein [Clostridia bacterium]